MANNHKNQENLAAAISAQMVVAMDEVRKRIREDKESENSDYAREKSKLDREREEFEKERKELDSRLKGEMLQFVSSIRTASIIVENKQAQKKTKSVWFRIKRLIGLE